MLSPSHVTWPSLTEISPEGYGPVRYGGTQKYVYACGTREHRYGIDNESHREPRMSQRERRSSTNWTKVVQTDDLVSHAPRRPPYPPTFIGDTSLRNHVYKSPDSLRENSSLGRTQSHLEPLSIVQVLTGSGRDQSSLAVARAEVT